MNPSKTPNDSSLAVDEVCAFFLGSRDFNGIRADLLASKLEGLTASEFIDLLTDLVETRRVDLAFDSHSVNPHIKRVPVLPPEEQVTKLREESPTTYCVYPHPDLMRERADPREYENKPFTRRLALVEPQLTPIFFDLGALERYFRDPRYHFDFGDYDGSISYREEHYESGALAKRDQVLLSSFGIGYDAKRHRVVVVYLRYLADLMPEHQRIWETHVVEGPCKANSDYERASIWGQWPEHYSVYAAFVQEQEEINKLAALIGKPSLFKETFQDNRPGGFAPMLRPTRRNLEDFVKLLDQMLSENENRAFFKGDISMETEVKRKDGKIQVEATGTLSLLERWLSSRYRTATGEDVAGKIVGPLREVRKRRSAIVHTRETDEYDPSLPDEQDRLLGDATRALTCLRFVLSSHPRAKAADYAPPDWLDSDQIVFY